MDPVTAQHIRETFYAGMLFLVCLSLWLYLSHRDADHAPTRWQKWKAFLAARYGSGPLVTSSGSDGVSGDQAVVEPVVGGATTAGQLIATTDNEDNSELPRQPLLPDEVRDIIRFQAQVEALASLYTSGQVTNIAKGIEDTFKCSRSSKDDSTYQRAKRALEPLIARPAVSTPIAGRETIAVFASDEV
jgi:hypothetical protein